MSPQDRHNAQDRASEPVRREPRPAEPANETRQGSQKTPFPSLPHTRLEGPQESEQLFRRLAQASFEGVLVHDNGTILDANETLARMVGYEVSELIGMEASRLVAPESRDFVLRTRLSGYEEPYEAVGLRKDGSTFPAELCAKTVPYDGRTVRVVAIRDVTARKRAQDALREKEHPFRLIAGASCEVIWDWDLTTGRIWRSAGMQKLFGHAPSERGPRLRWWHDRVHPEDRDRSHHGLYASISAGADSWFNEYRFRREDGSYAYVQERDYIIRDSEGKPLRMVGGLTDVTERKRAEEALRDSEERFHRLADAGFEGIVIHDRRKFVDANQALALMLGYDVSEIIGRDGLEFVAPEFRPLIEQRILSGYEAPYEVLCLRRDGSTFPAEVRGRNIPYGGHMARVTAVRDITEHKRAEQALRESEERFRLIAKATSDVIWDWDIRTGRAWRNEGMQRLFGHAPSEEGPQVTWWYERVHPEDRERSNRGFLATISAGGDSWFNEYRFRRADGSYAYVQERDYVIRDSDGKPVRLIGGMTDVTERKRTEEALRESEERFRELAENIRDVFFAIDKDLKYTYWNEASEDLTGISAEDAIGKSLYELFPEVKGTKADKAYLEALRTQQPQSFETEYQLGGKDRFFEISAYPSKTGLSVFVKDVTARKRAEEALRRREQEISVIADNVPAFFSYVDSDGCYRFANQRYEEWFGVPRTEIVGRHLTQVLGEATYERIRDHVERVLLGEHVRFEDVLPYRSGGARWVSADYVPDINDRGEVKGFFALVADITERKRAEEALRESERRCRLLAENVTDVIWTTDMNLRTTYVSPSATHLWGYSVEEVMTRTVDQMLTPASFDVAEKALAEELAAESTGQSDPSRSRTLELESVCRDGSTIWTEAKMSGLRDERGRLVGILGVSRDITERKRAEEALRESEERYRLLAENATDIIWIRDLNLRILYINPAVTRIRGYSVEEAMAHTLEETLTPASLEVARQTLAEGLKEVAQGGQPRWWTLELEHTCKDGSTIWLETRATGLRDEHGQVVQILGASRDISERRRAEEALQEAREELESRVERRMRHRSAYGLTFRELTVLHLVAAGESDKEIAATLGISTLTASKHLANILHKMDAVSRTEAGVRAVREGLLDE